MLCAAAAGGGSPARARGPLRATPGAQDTAQWHLQPEMHCERMIYFLGLMHDVMPRFLKYV